MAHGLDVRRTVVFITCLVMVSGGVIKNSTSEEVPVRPWCSAPTVVEGQTGAVTFFLGKDILSSESVFAILNRANERDIVVCHQTPKLICRVNTTLYEVDGFINDSLTLRIPNVTKDFEGAYMLQVYTNGSPQPLSNCTLFVKVNHEDKRCIAPLVTEGQTGTVTFFIRPDILASDDFFATLRRTKYPRKDLLVCYRQSPVRCTPTSPLYKSNGIVNHSLTLLIPNVTQYFEDTYHFQVYTGGQPWPTNTCPLHITAKSPDDLQNQSCLAPLVTEGQTSTMTFFIRPDLLSFDDFFATLRRAKNPEKYILVCDRQSPVKCLVSSHLYETDGIVGHRLILLIPNVTQEFMDTYYLQVYTNGSAEPSNSCVLQVKANNVGNGTDESTDTRTSLYTGVILVLLTTFILILVVLFITFTRGRIKKRMRDEQLSTEKDSDLKEEYGSEAVCAFFHIDLPRESAEGNPPGFGQVASLKKDEQSSTEVTDHTEENRPGDDRTRDEQSSAEESDIEEENGPADVKTRDEQSSAEESDIEEENGPADVKPGEQTPLLDEEVTQKLPGEQTPLLDEEVTQKLPPSPATKKPTVHKKPQWFQMVCGDNQAHEMLLTDRNVDGSFFITTSKTKPESYLFVRSGSGVDLIYINHKEDECWIEPEERFKTLQSLVKHYKQVKGCLPRTLVLPCLRQN